MVLSIAGEFFCSVSNLNNRNWIVVLGIKWLKRRESSQKGFSFKIAPCENSPLAAQAVVPILPWTAGNANHSKQQ